MLAPIEQLTCRHACAVYHSIGGPYHISRMFAHYMYIHVKLELKLHDMEMTWVYARISRLEIHIWDKHCESYSQATMYSVQPTESSFMVNESAIGFSVCMHGLYWQVSLSKWFCMGMSCYGWSPQKWSSWTMYSSHRWSPWTVHSSTDGPPAP